MLPVQIWVEEFENNYSKYIPNYEIHSFKLFLKVYKVIFLVVINRSMIFPQSFMYRLQRVLFSAACFITGKFSREEDVLKLGLFPMMERRKWHLLKANTTQEGLTFGPAHKTCWKRLLLKIFFNILQLNVLT